jgi:hypothetical protein
MYFLLHGWATGKSECGGQTYHAQIARVNEILLSDSIEEF